MAVHMLSHCCAELPGELGLLPKRATCSCTKSDDHFKTVAKMISPHRKMTFCVKYKTVYCEHDQQTATVPCPLRVLPAQFALNDHYQCHLYQTRFHTEGPVPVSFVYTIRTDFNQTAA